MPRRRVAACLAVAALVVACSGSKGETKTGSGSAQVEGVVIEPAASRNHIQGTVNYTGKKPPSGGDHYPIPVTCGAYSQEVPDEYAVHSLEHGATWITYDPGLDAASVQKLRAFASQPKVLVTPYSGLSTPVVVVAWEHRLELQSANDPRLQQFIDAYGNGQVAPEGKSACTGAGVPDQS